MTRRALVTGANGFVGAHVARALLQSGREVRAMARDGSDMRALEGVECETVVADLRDPDSLERAVAGCDEVFHVAADYRLWAPDEAPMYAANVGGTRNIIAASLRAGVSRIVYTSTVGALGVGADGIGHEDAPVSISEMIGPYKRSKFLAEQAALDAARAGAPIVIVNPSTPIGPLDYKPTPTGRIIVDFLNRRIPAYIDTGLNLVCVEDVARGHLLAAERGTAGEKYILGGENLTLQQMLARLGQIAGLAAPKIRVPWIAAYVFALAGEAIARAITHRAPRASLVEVRMARKKMFFDSGKARAELGYTSAPVDEGLARAVKFFREIGAAPAAA
jgi:dihydroflavonol-4-reductase